MLWIIITAIVSVLVSAAVTAVLVTNYHRKKTEATIGNAQDKAREIIDEALKGRIHSDKERIGQGD